MHILQCSEAVSCSPACSRTCSMLYLGYYTPVILEARVVPYMMSFTCFTALRSCSYTNLITLHEVCPDFCRPPSCHASGFLWSWSPWSNTLLSLSLTVFTHTTPAWRRSTRPLLTLSRPTPPPGPLTSPLMSLSSGPLSAYTQACRYLESNERSTLVRRMTVTFRQHGATGSIPRS